MALVKEEYLCQITIVEARHLESGDASGTVDPFVKVSCGNLDPQATTCETATTNPCWNQSFTFSGLELTDYQLETYELTVDVYHFNAFLRNTLIGSYSIGLSTLHRNQNHEFYNAWLTLLHPDFGHEIRGYLLVNCFIVGAGDNPPLHEIGEKAELEEEEEDELPPELMPPGQRSQLALKKQEVQVIGAPLVARKGYQFSINIYKAENLPNLTSVLGIGTTSPFISVRCAGVVDRTEVTQGNTLVTWNAKISYAVFQPIFNEKIVVRVWDRRRNRADTFIGSIPEVPSERDYFNLTSLLSRGGILPCRWFNVYGNPPEESSMFDSLKYLAGFLKKSYLGSAFHGRILLSMTLVPNARPETGVSKAAPYREPQQEMYDLQVVAYDLKSSEGLGSDITMEVKLGQYSTNPIRGRKNQDGAFSWGTYGERAEAKSIMFPVDRMQVPDVFIELYSSSIFGGKQRIGYIRRSINDLSDSPRWMSFKEINTKSDIAGYSPGMLLAMITFQLRSSGKSLAPKSKPTRAKFHLYFHLYCGGGIAPTLNESDVSCFPLLKIGGQKIDMDVSLRKKGNNPLWMWTGKEKVELLEDLNFEQNLIVEVRNDVTKMLGLFTREPPLIGHFTVPLNKCRDKEAKPYIFHLVNPDQEGVSQGRIIAMFYLTKEELGSNWMEELNFKVTLKPRVIHVAFIALRNLTPSYSSPELTYRLPGYKNKNDDTDITGTIAFKNQTDSENPNIEKLLTIGPVDLPEQGMYLPLLEIRLKDKSFFSRSECFFFVPMISFAEWIDEKERGALFKLYNLDFTPQDSIEQIPINHAQMPNEPTMAEDTSVSFTDYGGNTSGRQGDELAVGDIDLDQLRNIIDVKAPALSKRVEFMKTAADGVTQMENAKKYYEEKRQKILDEMISIKDPDELRLKEADRKQIEDQINNLESNMVTSDDFWKGDAEEDEDDFNYHRPLKKDGAYEDDLVLPYKTYPLLIRSKNTEKLSEYRIGEPSGGFIKLALSIRDADVDYQSLNPFNVTPENLRFDFFHPLLLMTERAEELIREITKPRVLTPRVYLYRGLNLSAVENKPDLVARAAGLDAMSSANTYPEITIGKGEHESKNYICDNKVLEENELNPMYFRSYELQGNLPKEWKLEIMIWCHVSFNRDQLIGRTTIDLEDRFYGIQRNTRKIMAEYLKSLASEQIEVSKDDIQKEHWIKLKSDMKKIAKSEPAKYVVPVEYRPLSHPKKKAKQGVLEMFVEALEADEAKIIPMENLLKPKPEDYEIRLIIWKCENVPRGQKEAVDIYFQAQFDPNGWLEDSEKKETDTHLGSNDGHGIFNYRLKFNVTIPCTFPRLRIVAIDFETFGTDEAISEIVIDMGAGFRKLQKEGSLKVEEKWVQMHLPNRPKTDGGRVLISTYIVTAAEAKDRPVGEGQNDPNRDPELEKPEEGRGISDYLKGTALDFNLFGFLNFGLIAKVIAILGALVAIAYLAIYASK